MIGRGLALARLAAVIATAAAIALLSAADSRGQDSPSGRLDSRLEAVAEAYEAGGESRALESAEKGGLDVDGGRLRVIVEAGAAPASTRAELVRAGAAVEGTYGSLIQVTAPPGRLREIASTPGVALVRPPLRPHLDVLGEGVAIAEADDWQAQGFTGAGAKVAVLDLGFAGYEALLGTELPATVTAMSFRADEDITGGGEVHGAGVAEVVHEMAPGAELYLANFDTEVELAAAADWFAAEGVDVVNASWSYFTSGPGDGTGIPNAIVSDSVADGVVWSVSAGNSATRHWSGQFLDVDEDGQHEFAAGDEENEITAGAGSLIIGELRWDDPFGSSCRDYDLYLLRTVGQNPVVVASSTNFQYDNGCVPGADPTEGFLYVAEATDTYYFVINEYFSTSDAFMHLYSARHSLSHAVAVGSLGQPADNPDVVTVGAVPYFDPDTTETFSSQGPTDDGRTKPDVTSTDGVSNVTYGSFFGTSASSPHIAGAATLVRAALPCLDPAGVKAFLEAHVVDLGAAGKDNIYGSGRVLLGAPPLDADADTVADDCDNCPAWPNSAQALPDWTVPAGDADCDGYPESAAAPPRAPESFIGTDGAAHCASTVTADDEPLPDAWPVDFNDDQLADGSDVLKFGVPFLSAAPGPPYAVRFDFNADGFINGSDVLQFGAFFLKRCAP